MPWLANRNPRANSLDKLSIGGHSGLLLRAPRGYSASSRWSQVLNLNKAAQTKGTWAQAQCSEKSILRARALEKRALLQGQSMQEARYQISLQSRSLGAI